MTRLFRIQSTMLVFISLLVGVGIYEVFGNISGLDSIGVAGMFSGFFIGLLSGKKLGRFSLYPSFLSSLCASAFFMILALLSMGTNDSIMLVLGQLAIGFCLLAGALVGSQWGGHLVITPKEQEAAENILEKREQLKEKRLDESKH